MRQDDGVQSELRYAKMKPVAYDWGAQSPTVHGDGYYGWATHHEDDEVEIVSFALY
jgi:hypothetical protein